RTGSGPERNGGVVPRVSPRCFHRGRRLGRPYPRRARAGVQAAVRLLPFGCGTVAFGAAVGFDCRVDLARGWRADLLPPAAHGRMFRVLKFRSMFQNPGRVEVQARRGDPRITRAGRMLRRTGLDELPQLWNILLGQMSFVGPRPQPEKERVTVEGVERDVYIRDVPGYALRHLLRPGLTGPAQLFAPRAVPHRYKFKYDLVYVRKMAAAASRASLFGDLRMLVYDLSLVVRSVWIAVHARREV